VLLPLVVTPIKRYERTHASTATIDPPM